MIRQKILMLLAGVALAFSACNNDEILEIGNTLTSENDKLETASAEFSVSTRTYAPDSVLTRGNACYLGRVVDPENGVCTESGFMSQLHILESFSLPNEQYIKARHDGRAAADSCEFAIYLDVPSSFCDTLAAMKLHITEMDRPMEENVEYYSNYDPVKKGFMRQNGVAKYEMFAYNDMGVKDSVRHATAYYDNIRVLLNEPYTDKQGNTYKDYGTYVMRQYYEHPEYFTNSYEFIHHVCPGFFFEISDGLGFHAAVPDIGLKVFYTVEEPDTTYSSAMTLAGTDEVLQTTRITNDKQRLDSLAINDQTCTYIKSPAGLFTEVTLPVADIMNGHENDSLLAASISFQRINNSVRDERSLNIPNTLLMVAKDSLDGFFRDNKLPDGLTSVLSSALTTATNVYSFSNVSSMISHLAAKRAEGISNNANWEAAHPDWNKVVLVPITTVETSTTSYYGTTSTTVTSVRHNLNMTSTRLVGGSQNPYDPVKISVVYAKFKH